ncbi:MAG: formate C-acetyltransferase/glycerol dehydratase family glycyl radical enzyme [Oscillospiraceae bacterium]|nr:formate C-acetyltransferase/glycerol dehydratase family glycyl radical enzyme [Oscillospiraceae bacterium]
MFAEERFASLEQARIVTSVYKSNPSLPRNLQRSVALAESLAGVDIRITPGELIVGNRTGSARAGVISPESGLRWVDDELETLPTRLQDRFRIRREDKKEFRREILPFWKGQTLEDILDEVIGTEMAAIDMVAKINQTDHSQGHISPNTAGWLKFGPAGLRDIAYAKEIEILSKADFYDAIAITLDGACLFMKRYSGVAREMANCAVNPGELLEIARICDKISSQPPETFHEALQSVWFLYVILHLESNASSFSPGRMDQYLYPYYLGDIRAGRLTPEYALELVECLFLKFNQIVYMRSSSSARYFAGFPIGFNVALGGQDSDGNDALNDLSYIMLRAHEHLRLPQPNLSARLHDKSPERFLTRCAQVIGKGSGMPQVFNDEAVIPALRSVSISPADARNYAIVGCVELTSMGNSLGWGSAAMFNIVKALELALNDGRCLLTGERLGAQTGTLLDHETFDDVERALEAQIDFFLGRMIHCCEIVDKTHAELLPSPFLSSVVDDCMERGLDVTAGGAFYNLSGIQAVQCANLADSLAALKTLVYDEKIVDRTDLYNALLSNYKDAEPMRLLIVDSAPKYGADVEWVDELANKWATLFSEKLYRYTNVRGGRYHMGLHTVTAHIPMGANVGATPDGRKAGQPLADGGISPTRNRDADEPAAVLRSAAHIRPESSSNGALLNMKFSPSLFYTEDGINRFVGLLRDFVKLRIIHAQFNVINNDDMLAAQEQPEMYRNLLACVAGYSAFFTELPPDLQQEIIERVQYT